MAWLGTWAKRVKLTIDQNDIDDALANFPILVRISASSGHSSKDISFVFNELESNDNRKKIAVTTSDGQTQCYVEIEKWDDANEKAWLWVKVPSVASGADTDLYLYYDKTKADNTDYVGDPGSAPAEAVWDDNYVGVWHLGEDPTPDGVQMKDSTSNGNDGTSEGSMTSEDLVGGKIGKALDFDGVNDGINCGKDASLNIDGGSFTIGCWINPILLGKNDCFLGRYGTGWIFRTDHADANELQFYSGSTIYATSGLDILTAEEWQRVEVVYNGDTYKLYHNGSLIYTSAGSQGATTGDDYDLRIGRIEQTGFSFPGFIDEVRISKTNRAAEWIKASYESERDHLLDFGSEETPNEPPGLENKSANMAAKMMAAGVL